MKDRYESYRWEPDYFDDECNPDLDGCSDPLGWILVAAVFALLVIMGATGLPFTLF